MHDWARAQRRGVRGRRPVEARALFPRGAARTCTPPWRASASRCAAAAACSTPRRSARSKWSARTRPTFMNRMYVNAWTSLGRRPLPLRRAAARRRLRLRRRRRRAHGGGPLPRHDDHRRRRARARVDGGLPADRMAGACGLAHLDHRAVGGDRRAGAGPRAGAAALVEGIDISRRGAAAHERRARPHLRRADAAVPRELHRRAGIRDQRARRLRPCRVGGGVRRPGSAHGITPYGTEAMHVLRAEKGYIIVGQDTDGTVTPDDAGLGWAIGKNKPDFVGKRSLQRPAMQSADRKQLVGPAHRRPAARARGRRAGAWRRQRAARPLRPHRARHLLLSQRRARPLDRARARRRRPRADRPDALRAEGRRRRPCRSLRPSSTTRKERASMADVSAARAAAATSRSASRSSPCRRPHATSCAAGSRCGQLRKQPLGLGLSAQACRAHTQGRRAALWLGPDERLLIAPAVRGSGTRGLACEGAARAPALAGRCQPPPERV